MGWSKTLTHKLTDIWTPARAKWGGGGGGGGGKGGLSPPTLETGGAKPPRITTCLYYNSNSKCLYVSAK